MVGASFTWRHRYKTVSCWTPCPRGLSLGNYNICDSCGFDILQAIWAVEISGFETMVLMDTNTTDQDYCRNRFGYGMVCSPAITAAGGG